MSDMKEQFMADAGLAGISSVVATLPLGYSLGISRTKDSVDYKLVFNAGNSEIAPGRVAAPILAGAGLNSVTVSTSSQGNNHIGGVVCVHATATTGTYFWGATEGLVGGLAADSASIPTGSAFAIGDNGSVQLMPQSVTTGKVAVGVVVTSVSNGGAKTGSAYISLFS